MVLDPATITRLLGCIEANTLILLCGAGLSIPAPSNLMSAVSVSRDCYDKYSPVAVLPPAIRDDVDAIAGHFHKRGEFATVFLGLVPWNELVGEPNAGHAAAADLLICGAVRAILSANFDPLIEQWANGKKIALQGALDGLEATSFGDTPAPLLKVHGCLVRKRNETLWTHEQLGDPSVRTRITSCSQWLAINLPGKDLVVVGFWTDWGYLGSVLADAINTQPFNSVTVIDPEADAVLQAKAPDLWARLTGAGIPFQHIAASGSDALEDLRVGFGKVWCRRFMDRADALLQAEGKRLSAATRATFDMMSCDELYDFRRDGEGVPYDRAATTKRPVAESGPAALLHALLIQAGAARQGAWHVQRGQRVRVVHGSGQVLSSVRQRYREPPALPEADVIVCAGSVDPRVPGALIASGSGKSIMRPARGGRSRWITMEEARMEFVL